MINLNNGAAETPSGRKSCLKYIQFIGVEVMLRPSRNPFVGLGKGVISSLRSALIRMKLEQDSL